MKILGHRGASARVLENTVAAFRRAEADGADGVELDVMLCRTGDAIVFHDDNLMRLAGRKDRIAEMSLADIRGVRLRSGETIPTLREVFEALGSRMLVNVELKAERADDAGVRALAKAVAADLAAAPARPRENIIFSSFDPRALSAIAAVAADVPRGVLVALGSPMAPRLAGWLRDLGAVAVHPENAMCSLDAVRAWHATGLAVNVWTVDDPGRVRALRDMGVDALISNDPARARAALTV